MTLEVAENQHTVKFGKTCADKVFLQHTSAFHGNGERTGFIHDDHIRNIGKAMILGKLIVHGGLGTAAAVCGIAFDDGAVYVLHKLLDEVGTQVVGLIGFTGMYLYCRILAGDLYAKSFIDCHQCFGCDLRGVINNTFRIRIIIFQICRLDGGTAVGNNFIHRFYGRVGILGGVSRSVGIRCVSGCGRCAVRGSIIGTRCVFSVRRSIRRVACVIASCAGNQHNERKHKRQNLFDVILHFS